MARIISYALVASAIVVIGLFAAVRTTEVLDPVVESNTMLARISSIGLDDGSISGRVSGAQAGLLAYAEKPALGWGPENFLIAWGKYVSPDAAEHNQFDQAHNKLVEELTTKGTLGFVSYMLVWVAMAWAMFRSIRRRRGYEQLSVLIIAATMLAYFVQNLFLFDTPVTLMQFSLLAAFAVAQEYWADEGERKRTRSWMSEKLRGRLSPRRVSVALRASWGAVCLMALVSVVVIASLYALNLRAYNAAADIASFGLLAGTGATWEERLVYAEDSISTFPGLANYPRRHIIRDSFDRLPRLSDEEFWAEVELMESTGNDALDVEPDNWRIIAMLVLLHQTAAERDAEYVAKARVGLDKMAAIAPNLPDTRILTEHQYILEQATATP